MPQVTKISLSPLPPRRYGVGYHMTVVKEQQCISAKVSQLVTSMIAGAKQVTDVGAELSFVLPSSSTPQFPALFDVLDGMAACVSVCLSVCQIVCLSVCLCVSLSIFLCITGGLLQSIASDCDRS